MLTSARLPSTRSTVTLPTRSSCGLRLIGTRTSVRELQWMLMTERWSGASNAQRAVQETGDAHASSTPTGIARPPQRLRPPERSSLCWSCESWPASSSSRRAARVLSYSNDVHTTTALIVFSGMPRACFNAHARVAAPFGNVAGRTSPLPRAHAQTRNDLCRICVDIGVGVAVNGAALDDQLAASKAVIAASKLPFNTRYQGRRRSAVAGRHAEIQRQGGVMIFLQRTGRLANRNVLLHD